MINDVIKNSVRFLILILLQVLIVQNIRLGPYVILLPYVLFILLLPFETPKLWVLLIAFFTGLVIDMFYDTAGIHAASCTMIGFLRYFILKLLSPREGYDVGLSPTIESMGSLWFITYAFIINDFIVLNQIYTFTFVKINYGRYSSTYQWTSPRLFQNVIRRGHFER